MALTKDNGNLFGGNGAWFIVLILFFLGGMGGWGNNNSAMQGAMTRSDLYEGLNSQNTFSEFRSVQNEITNGFANVQQSMCRASADNALALSSGFSGVQSAIADTRYAMQNCCCEIKNAIHAEGESTRALIQQNTIQDLRDRLQDSKAENLATGLTTAQVIQTNNLENFIRVILDNKTVTATE